MTLPCTPTVVMRLGTGAGFGIPLILGDASTGILGTNVLASANAEFVEITDEVQRISITHGRDRQFETYLPGTCIIQFLDFNGDWNPANTSGPYYGKIKPMALVRVETEYQSTGYFLFTGYISSWDYTWPDQSSPYAIVTIQAIDAFRVLQLANIDDVPGAANKDLPGERINLILDAVGWPSTLRNIDDGDTELENDPGGFRSALQAIQTIEQSDLGAFFIDHGGKATYYSRVTLSQLAATANPYEFDDTGTNIQYQDIDVNFDETELANEVTFTRLSGQPQTVSDSDSIDEYFLRSYNRSGLMMETNSLALARATSVLAYRKQPRIRIDNFTLDMSSDTSRVEPGLALEIGQPVIVTKSMAGGTDISLRLSIQGHTSDITPDRWITTFTTAYPLSTAFILGSTEFGILGTNTL
jgi:hypothetical protein